MLEIIVTLAFYTSNCHNAKRKEKKMIFYWKGKQGKMEKQEEHKLALFQKYKLITHQNK